MRRVIMPMRLRITTLATLGVALAALAPGCGPMIPIEPVGPQECPAALLEGTLVRIEDSGIGVRQADVDVTYPVEWPDGWSVEEVDGVRHLLGGGGRVVGSEGDQFSAGGSFTPGPVEVFRPCGGIDITPASE